MLGAVGKGFQDLTGRGMLGGAAFRQDGNRIEKTTATATTLYLVATVNPSGNPQVVEEFTLSGGVTNLSKVYAYGLRLISQRQVASGTVSFYGYEAHGSTRFLSSTNGTITDTYAYDGYGTLLASTGSTPNNYLYCGEQWAPDLGLYYLRARYFNPGTGRFWTMDTDEGWQEDPQSLHKYLYCWADPVNLHDPSGHDGLAELSIAELGVVTLAAFTSAAIVEAKTHAIGTLLVVSYQGFHNALANAADEYKFYNKKQTEAVVTGLIATATAHVAKLEGYGGGSDPNDPRNHWKKEIKAALDRAKRLIEKRLTGDKQTDLLKQVKDLADKAKVDLE